MPRKRTTCPCGCGQIPNRGRFVRGHGIPLTTPVATIDEQQFWPHVDCSSDDGCWPWTGQIDHWGYGRLPVDGRGVFAHRVAWTLTDAPSPDGSFVLHTCDTPLCVRNDTIGTYEVDGVSYPRRGHLWLGDNTANMRDRWEKGRYASGAESWATLHPESMPRGSGHGNAKLTADIVLEARRQYSGGEISAGKLAKIHGVSQHTMWEALTEKTWKHL